jgi:hypothetical protein
MRFHLLSFHGKLLARAENSTNICQLSLNDVSETTNLVAVDLEESAFRQPYEDFIEKRASEPVLAHIRFMGEFWVYPRPATRTICLKSGEYFVGASPQGQVEINRLEANLWEQFLPVSEEEIRFLQMLNQSDWIIKSSRQVVSGSSIAISERFMLLIGAITLPLQYNLPLDHVHAPFRFVVFIDGWRIDEIILYKPLLYYLAFGQENVFEQLSLSLESLGRVAQFDGQVLVYTDRTPGEIHALAAWLKPEQMVVRHIPAVDWVGYVAGKYCILEEDIAHSFQPVVYMDPDIIYNTNLDPLLVTMACATRLTAPIEEFSGLEHAPSVGATLLQLDLEQPRFAAGFNCGTLGIPNLPMHRHTVELIRKIICNFTAQRGRSALHWVDQEAANYVSYKIGHFETHEVSRFVRYGFGERPTLTEPRTGLVHFWGVSRHERPAIMRDYLDRVLKAFEQPTIEE